ncbi:hypothetical protein CLE01_10520 [Cryobacterium levicorallinum]|uniref:Uncharacterized protein n=1 Tax=Cryobacterium levicorallinum TaxID=995038 RepID=A0ABY1ECE1_9MICO|nr:hypothetical protein CLE01_10520 [Cryobacterium levicorallinum]SFH43122.1 hypothetical protein SAMN05216274_10564 [Cryobacterium levicorallinum]
MNDSSQENAASRKSLAEHPSDSDAEAEKRRQYVAANRDRIREMNRLWRAEHLERARQINRDSERRAAARRHRETEVRARGRERAKRWREVHPDRRREYQQRWVEENRAKVREYYNRYYEAHRDDVNARAAARRDADPDRTKQISKEWADRNKERRAELQRTRRSDPETYQSELEVNAAARRLKRSLSRAGLPPKRLHPTTAAERRVDEREADAYFNDLSRPEHLRQFTVFAESLTEHMLKNGARMREFAEAYVENRARIGLPTVPVENIVYARAVELVVEWMRRVDLLTSRDVAAAVRSTKAEVRRAERQQQFDRLVKTVVAQVQRNSARYVVDAEIENRARAHQGKPRASVESLVVQLAMEEVIERVPTSSLTIEDARTAARVARLRVSISDQARLNAGVDRIQRQPFG